MEVISLFKEYLRYLKSPTYAYKRDQPLDLVDVTKLYFMVFALELLMFIPMSSLVGVENLPHAMETVMEQYSGWQVFMLAVIIAPILEEFMFRFHLRYKPLIFLFLIICLTGFNYLVVGDTLEIDAHAAMHDPWIVLDSVTRYLPYVGIMGLLYLLYLGIAQLRKLVDRMIVSEFAFVFYLTAVIFALVHIFNFELGTTPWYFIPLLVMPQFVLALFLGYVRVRNNILYSIYVHMLNNSIPMLLFFLASLSGDLQ
jgi:hypothetical protein